MKISEMKVNRVREVNKIKYLDGMYSVDGTNVCTHVLWRDAKVGKPGGVEAQFRRHPVERRTWPLRPAGLNADWWRGRDEQDHLALIKF